MKQCCRTEQWIREGRPELFRLNSSLSNVENFAYAVITMDDFHMANSSLICEELKYDIAEDVAYQIINSRELEMLLYDLPEGSLVTTISENASAPELRPASYRNYLSSLQSEQSARLVKDPSRDFVLSVLNDLEARVMAR